MLENGEIIILENKEYICLKNVEFEGQVYIYLMSNFKPLEIKFAKQLTIGEDEFKIEIINNSEEKEKVMKLFMENFDK